jgi:hypothetical protein
MGRRVIVSISAALLLVAAAAPGQAQSQLPRPGQLPPPGGQQQPQQPPQQRPQPQQTQPQQQQAQPQQQQGANKPYKAVAVTAPKPMDDPSFEAFRKQLGAIAEKKDRAALAALVSKSFFWMGEKGDKADKKKSGFDNLAKAIGLVGKDADDGWDTLAGFAADPTAAPYPEKKDTICAPAQPAFDDNEFGALIKATGTEDADWGYPVQAGVEMHATAQANSPVVEKLGAHFVRVLEDEAAGNQQVPMLKIVAPSGKTGYVPADAVSPLGNDEMCYVKEGGAWKIAGFSGGE